MNQKIAKADTRIVKNKPSISVQRQSHVGKSTVFFGGGGGGSLTWNKSQVIEKLKL